jgi:hypothetical protein
MAALLSPRGNEEQEVRRTVRHISTIKTVIYRRTFSVQRMWLPSFPGGQRRQRNYLGKIGTGNFVQHAEASNIAGHYLFLQS